MNVYKYSEITERIIGCSLKVHTFLGNGFQEVVYQRSLEMEFIQSKLDFAREIEMEIFYRDFPQSVGTRRADFIVKEKVLVELKAVTSLNNIHMAQVLNYLKAYRLEVGLLLNFGEPSLKVKRLILSSNWNHRSS